MSDYATINPMTSQAFFRELQAGSNPRRRHHRRKKAVHATHNPASVSIVDQGTSYVVSAEKITWSDAFGAQTAMAGTWAYQDIYNRLAANPTNKAKLDTIGQSGLSAGIEAGKEAAGAVADILSPLFGLASAAEESGGSAPTSGGEPDNTLLYVGLGIGALVLVGGGLYFLLKK